MASRSVRLAVLRARHDPAGVRVPDAPCREFVLANAAGTAVLQFWERQSEGYLDLGGSVLFPWVDVDLPPQTSTAPGPERSHLVAAARAATGPAADGFDGYLVLVSPPTRHAVNPQAGEPGQPDTVAVGINAGAVGSGCVLTAPSDDHTFFCHEIGHVLGFTHTYGLPNNGAEWDGAPPWAIGDEYGDPYDVMSSGTFGSRWLSDDPAHPQPYYTASPTFVGPPVAGWSAAPGMGPALARAALHHALPEALGAVTVLTAPPPGTELSATLHAAHTAGGPRLLAVDPRGGPAALGRVYVEYRRATGWDAGLGTTGPELDRQAVVVHAIAPDAGGTPRCYYRGRVPVPLELDADLAVPDQPLVVRVSEAADDIEDTVVITLATSASRGVLLTPAFEPAVTVPLREETRTGDFGVLHGGDYLVGGTSQVRATSVGFGGTGDPLDPGPTAVWTVAGQVVPPGPETEVAAASVRCSLDPTGSVLGIAAEPGTAPVSVEVGCTVSEGGASATASVRVDPVRRWRGLRPTDVRRYLVHLAVTAEQAGLRTDAAALRRLIAEQDPFHDEMLGPPATLHPFLERLAAVDPRRGAALADLVRFASGGAP